MEFTNFIDDTEKMYDFLSLTKEDFLKMYDYLTEQEYDLTVEALNEETLADLMRRAENILIEQNSLDNEDENLDSIDVSEFKGNINTYAKTNLSEEKYQEFVDICDSMGC